MPTLAGAIWIWEKSGCLWTRVFTNATREKLFARLTRLGLAEHVEATCHFFTRFGAGGVGFDILWKELTREELREKVTKL